MFLSITTTTIEAQHQWFLVRLKMWFAINVGSLGTTNVIVQVTKVVVVAMLVVVHLMGPVHHVVEVPMVSNGQMSSMMRALRSLKSSITCSIWVQQLH